MPEDNMPRRKSTRKVTWIGCLIFAVVGVGFGVIKSSAGSRFTCSKISGIDLPNWHAFSAGGDFAAICSAPNVPDSVYTDIASAGYRFSSVADYAGGDYINYFSKKGLTIEAQGFDNETNLVLRLGEDH